MKFCDKRKKHSDMIVLFCDFQRLSWQLVQNWSELYRELRSGRATKNFQKTFLSAFSFAWWNSVYASWRYSRTLIVNDEQNFEQFWAIHKWLICQSWCGWLQIFHQFIVAENFLSCIVFFSSAVYHKRNEFFRNVEVLPSRVWEVDQILFLLHSLRKFEKNGLGRPCQLRCVFIPDFQQSWCNWNCGGWNFT